MSQFPYFKCFWHLPAFPIGFLGVVVPLMVGCVGPQRARDRTLLKEVDAPTVAASVQKLREWPRVSDGWFCRSDWQAYVELARELQQVDPQILESGLRAFHDKVELSVDVWSELSKPYILLRIMFEVPDHISEDLREIRDEEIIGSVSVPVFPPDSPFVENDSTPVAWTKDGPVLTAQLPNAFVATGAPYSPAAEYRFFRTYFKSRALPAKLSDLRAEKRHPLAPPVKGKHEIQRGHSDISRNAGK